MSDFGQWLEALPDDAEPTHEIVWTPTFRARVALPPWQDPDDALADFTMGWNDGVADDDNWWYDNVGEVGWVVSMENDGSVAEIRDLAHKRGPAP